MSNEEEGSMNEDEDDEAVHRSYHRPSKDGRRPSPQRHPTPSQYSSSSPPTPSIEISHPSFRDRHQQKRFTKKHQRPRERLRSSSTPSSTSSEEDQANRPEHSRSRNPKRHVETNSFSRNDRYADRREEGSSSSRSPASYNKYPWHPRSSTGGSKNSEHSRPVSARDDDSPKGSGMLRAQRFQNKENQAATTIQTHYRRYRARKLNQPERSRHSHRLSGDYDEQIRREHAATVIQSHCRGYSTRNKLKKQKQAATKIQATYRGYNARKKYKQTRQRSQQEITQTESSQERSDSRASSDYSTAGDILFPDSESVLVIGGINPFLKWSRQDCCRLMQYNPSTGDWTSKGSLPKPMAYFTAVTYNGLVYCCGGCDPNTADEGDNIKATADMWELNPRTGQWSPLPSMDEPRIHHSMVVHSKYIYVIGGKNCRGQIVDSVERFSLRRRSWTTVASLKYARMCAGAASYDDSIWVVGGLTDIASSCPLMVQVECYNPHDNVWYDHVPLPHPLYQPAPTVYDNQLLLVGGATAIDSTIHSTTDVVKFNKDIEAWSRMDTLKYARHGAHLITLGGELFVVGGIMSPGDKAVKRVETYLAKKKTFVRANWRLPFPLIAFGCVVLPRGDQIEEFH